MLKFNRALSLAWIKFRQKGWKNLFSIISICLGSLTILTIVTAINGITPQAEKILMDDIYGRNLVVFDENRRGNVWEYSEEMDMNGENESTLSEVEKAVEDYNVDKIYVQENSYMRRFLLEEIEYNKQEEYDDKGEFDVPFQGLSLRTQNEIFVSDMIDDGESFDDKYEKKVPILIPRSVLKEAEDYESIEDFPTKDVLEDIYGKNKANYEKLKQKYIGKTFKLSEAIINEDSYRRFEVEEFYDGEAVQEIEEEAMFQFDGFNRNAKKPESIETGIECVVVGFSNNYSFIIPDWTYENEKVAKLFEAKESQFFPQDNYYGMYDSKYILEFPDKKSSDKFLKNYYDIKVGGFFSFMGNAGWDLVIVSPLEAFELFISGASRVAIWIAGFFMFIGALFTISIISKVISDSRKEIGVFRAVGARKFDVLKIYLSYTFILCNIGFVAGWLIAIILNVILSHFFGDMAFYGMAMSKMNFTSDQPLFMFVSFPILDLIKIYVVIVLSTMLAGIIPCRKISKIDPIVVLREG